MGYDAEMTINTGGERPAVVADMGNMTWNVGGMFELALGCRLGCLDGETGRELIPRLEKAMSHMRHPDNRQRYLDLEPDNGWGSYDGACRYLQGILEACRDHPKATLRIS